MRQPDRPSQAFVALRGAALGVDDISRAEIRKWFDLNTNGSDGDFYGMVLRAEQPVELFRAAYAVLGREDRIRWRRWLMRWVNVNGVITLSKRD